MDVRPKYNTLFVRLYVLMTCLGIGLGVAISAGGAARFSGPSFVTPRALVEWMPLAPHWVWGLLFTAYGLTLVFSLGRLTAVHVLRFGIAVYLFFVLSFLGSVLADPRASITGCVAYGIFAAVHLYLSDHLAHRGWEGC